MHELLLFSGVPQSRHAQILSILAGLTATPAPRRISELHHIFKPTKSSSLRAPQKGRPGEGGSGPAFTTYEDLTEDLTRRSSYAEGIADDEAQNDSGEERWTCATCELPDAGTNSRQTISRRKNVVPVHAEDIANFATKNEFALINRYILEGHEFIFNNILLRLTRCILIAEVPPDQPLDFNPSTFEKVLLDRSGSYYLQASILVEDRASTELMDRARDELLGLKEELNGSLDLGVVERMALDPRIRS